jgi:hypothetical protein
MEITLRFVYIKIPGPVCEMWYWSFSKEYGVAQLWFLKRFGIGLRWKG